MSNVFYSRSTGGFYVLEIHGDDVPLDAVKISEELHVELLGKQASGKEIVSDSKGFPIAVDRKAVAPAVISRAKGKLVLIRAGLWDRVVQMAKAIQDDAARAVVEVALYDSQEWRRDSPTLTRMVELLGLTSDETDALFVEADQVVL